MNLLDQRPWQHPAFFRTVIALPLAIVTVGLGLLFYAAYDWNNVNTQATALQTEVTEEQTHIKDQRMALLNKLRTEDSLLTTIYQRTGLTYSSNEPFMKILAARPPGIRFISIQKQDVHNYSTTLETLDRNGFVTFTESIDKLHWHLQNPTTSAGPNNTDHLTATVNVP